MRIARVFPRRTSATPDDELAFTTPPPKVLPDIDEVHISVAFTYDMPKAEQLVEAWAKTGLPVELGGPAFNEPGSDFVPGRYLKQGYVITSRGCPNRCWFCSVPRREGYKLRELPIVSGHNILDDNLLSCSETHIRAVFDMLRRQPEKPIFTGGLEAKLLKPWHVDLLREAKTKRMYFAYDTADDYEPLVYAGKLLQDGGFSKSSHTAKCYVLIGYPGDTFDNAEKRLIDAWKAGFFPFAMLYREPDEQGRRVLESAHGSSADVSAGFAKRNFRRNEKGEGLTEWKQFQRLWARPQIVARKLQTI